MLDFETYSVEAFWTALDRAYEFTLNHRELVCIVCGRTGSRSDFAILTDHCMFGGGVLERYKCPNCDAVFGPQKYLDLSEEFVNRDYALLYARYAEANSTESEIRTFRSLEPTLTKFISIGGAVSGVKRLLASERKDLKFGDLSLTLHRLIRTSYRASNKSLQSSMGFFQTM